LDGQCSIEKNTDIFLKGEKQVVLIFNYADTEQTPAGRMESREEPTPFPLSLNMD